MHLHCVNRWPNSCLPRSTFCLMTSCQFLRGTFLSLHSSSQLYLECVFKVKLKETVDTHAPRSSNYKKHKQRKKQRTRPYLLFLHEKSWLVKEKSKAFVVCSVEKVVRDCGSRRGCHRSESSHALPFLLPFLSLCHGTHTDLIKHASML